MYTNAKQNYSSFMFNDIPWKTILRENYGCTEHLTSREVQSVSRWIQERMLLSLCIMANLSGVWSWSLLSVTFAKRMWLWSMLARPKFTASSQKMCALPENRVVPRWNTPQTPTTRIYATYSYVVFILTFTFQTRKNLLNINV